MKDRSESSVNAMTGAEIGARARARREAAGVSQSALAARAEVSPPTARQYETDSESVKTAEKRERLRLAYEALQIKGECK